MFKFFLQKSIIILLAFTLYSCGFQVVYDERNKQAEFDYEKELAAIIIKKTRAKVDQNLKSNLYDLLNPDYVKVEPKYFLVINLKKLTSSTFTTSSGASGRNRVILNANYELFSLESGELIAIGSSTINDNYDVTSNRFASYSADEYISTNLTKVLAQNIRNALINDLVEMHRKSLKKNEEDNDSAKDNSSTNKATLAKKAKIRTKN